MIRPEELRIGNKIKGNVVYQGEAKTFERFNESLTVAFFSDGSIHGIGEFLKDCSPIELNEEWLIKLGFLLENNNKRSFLQQTGVGINHWQMRVRRNHSGFDWLSDNWGIGVHLRYVHQLQNLYFALTGSDLTIKG